MADLLKLEKFSFGVGDRFAHQARAQLQAFILAAQQGADVTPVWNKSNREHLIVGSEPAGTRAAVEAAVKALRWQKPYHVDADHIRLQTVDRFIPHSDFYTIDVADWIGKPADAETGGGLYQAACRAGGDGFDSRDRIAICKPRPARGGARGWQVSAGGAGSRQKSTATSPS